MLVWSHVLFGKPASTPYQVRGMLFPGHILTRASEPRLPHGLAQQRIEAAAADCAEHRNDRGHDRERRAHTKTEKRHGHQLAVLHDENQDGGQKHDDDGQINPAHGSPLAFLKGWLRVYSVQGPGTRARWLQFESSSRSRFLMKHDVFGKPASTFPDHALAIVG